MPPVFLDHEGLCHDLIAVPKPLLRRLAETAWLRHVGLAHQHRATMRDLCAIDLDLLRTDCSNLVPLDLARQSALQSGAFVFASSHSKFDSSKTGQCELCGVLDDACHRMCHCPRYALERDPFQWVCDRWDTLPVCLTHHLLVPANPFGPGFRSMLHALVDSTNQHQSLDVSVGTQHIFTDGSCFSSGSSGLALAGWGLVHAGTGLVLSCGPVPGLQQTAPRAELHAMLSAVLWAVRVRQRNTIWSDALHVVDKMQLMAQGHLELDSLENNDLWGRIQAAWAQLDDCPVQVLHTPSHLDISACERSLEEWLAVWNGRADAVAVFANNNRPANFLVQHANAVRYHEDMQAVLRALRRLYCAVAESTADGARRREVQVEECERSIDTDVLIPETEPPLPSLLEALPIGWQALASALKTRVPWSFTHAIMQFLLAQGELFTESFSVSWMEITVVLLEVASIKFPAVCPTTGRWVDAEVLKLP